jgi:NAD(P)-dependent dehydrogenase (short-subunit alcohol dehydrogenase family)
MSERRTAIVTGGGGGIGGACAEAIAAAGDAVAVLDWDRDRAEATRDRIEAAGGTAIALEVNAADDAAMEAAVLRVGEELGPVEVAVGTVSDERHDHALRTSVDDLAAGFLGTTGAALALARPAAEQMIERGRGGRIVFIGSLHATLAFPEATSYNVAEASLHSLARSLARDLLPHRIGVNVVEPGWIRTPGESHWYTDEQLDAAERRQPWGRLGQPADIGAAVAFLASPAAELITGTTLRVDGGLSLRMTDLPGAES